MDLTHVTAFESRQMMHAIRIDRLDGVHLAADDFINSLEQAWPGIGRPVSYPRFASTTALSRWGLGMIDAHEVGIQLALQDGASAGLQVIVQELGTLDRAVAATAGRLEALTKVTQRAGQATAAVESVRAPMVAEPAALAAEPVAAGALVSARSLAPELAVVAREKDLARPAATPVTLRTVATPVLAAPVAAIAAPIGVTPGVAAPEIAAPVAMSAAAVVAMALAKPGVAGPVAAPVRAAAPIVPQFVLQSVADLAPAAPGRAPAAEPARWAATEIPTAPIMPAAAGPMARVAPVMQTPRVAPAAPMKPGLPIDAIEPIRTMERGMRQTPAAPVPRVAALRAAAQAPAAPIAGRPGGQAAMPGQELLPGRPAVPPAQAQEEGGKSGGDVMLDGHLVGHWLAERMGRDAARPSAGMTHFNPRQAAAWTPSGAL